MPTNSKQAAQSRRRQGGSRRLSWIGLILSVLLVTAAIGASPLSARPRQAVELLYFRGESEDEVAYLEWATGTENDTAGFRLERGPGADGPFTPLPGYDFVQASGNIAAGAVYSATDESVVNGETYWYRLVELALDNEEANRWTLELTIEPGATGTIVASTGQPPADNGPTATSSRGLPAPSVDSAQVEVTVVTTPLGSPGTATPAATVAAPDANNDTASNAYPAPLQEPTASDAYPGTVEAPAAPSTPLPTMEAAAPPAEVAITALPAAGARPAAASSNETDTPLLGGRTIGRGTTPEESAPETDSAQQGASSSTLLLWVGFVASFLIFVGGVAFSIFLSLRRRSDTL